MQTPHGIITTAEHEAEARRNAELAFYAWLIGTLGFAGVELWARKGRTTFSMCVRRVFVTKHPLGRAALAAGMTVLYVHFVRQKADLGVLETKVVRR